MKSEIISDGLNLTELPKLADLVIIDSHVTKGSDTSREQKKAFKKLIQEQLEKNGTTIIPCDSGSRGLELLACTRRFLEKLGAAAKVFYVHTMSDRALEIARFHLEWMSTKASQPETGKSGEMEFSEDKRVSCITSMQQFAQIKTEGAKVIFCTHSSLNYGLGYSLLQNFIEDPNATFIFPFKPLPNTWAGHFKKIKPYDLVELKIPERMKIVSPRKSSEAIMKIDSSHPNTNEPLFNLMQVPEISRKESTGKLLQSKSSLFKNKPFMCFEDSEKKRKTDEFGEVVTDQDKKQWKKLNPSEEEINMLVDNKKKQDDISINIVVTKLRKLEYTGTYAYTYKTLRVVPRCRFFFINLEGINDTESLNLIIKCVQPKRVILFNSSQTSQKNIKVNLYRCRLIHNNQIKQA